MRMVLAALMILPLVGACSAKPETLTMASAEGHKYAHLYQALNSKTYQDPAFNWIIPYSQILSTDKEARKN